MPDIGAHLAQAEHNEQFLQTLGLPETPYLDWAVTVIFYAALHYIRALAARHQLANISSYAEMDRLFERVPVFRRNRDLYVDRRQMKDDSRVARYECRSLPPSEVIDLRDGELARIRGFVRAQLADAR